MKAAGGRKSWIPLFNSLCLISSGVFNMDTPWLHVYTAHKLSLLQQRTLRLTSELTASKWLSVRNLVLEAFLVDGSREKEARLRLYTPAVTYIKVRRGRSRGSPFLVLKRSSGFGERLPLSSRRQVGAPQRSETSKPRHRWSRCGRRRSEETSLWRTQN